MKKANIGLLFLFLLNGMVAFGQNESDLNNFLQAEKDDASKLIGAYISPVIRGISYGMTNGWYHTGKTHKKLGIDLGVTISGVMMPTSDETFDPTKIGLSANTIPNQTSAPTIIGAETNSSYTVSHSPLPPISINGPQGVDLKGKVGKNWVPVPMIQLGIGLVKNTDLKIRYVPQTKSGDSQIKMLGFGLMHDIKQYLPGVKALPFDLSVLVAYNSVSGYSALTNTDQSNDGKPYSANGQVNYKLNSWVAQAIVSKKFSILTVYLGLGYAAVSSNVNINGTFTLDPYNLGVSITDPLAIKYNNNGAKLTTGLRIKLGPLYFNGDYTVQKYNSLTVGVGLSVR
ncbi:MAG: hypothetical protein JST48_13090 [Bacteroidetes bacterium]|nr:hypothetical protein [Bacteroidota bacterium]